MAFKINSLSVPGKNASGNTVTLINASLRSSGYSLDLVEIPWKNGFGTKYTLINSGLFSKRYVPQPFNATIEITQDSGAGWTQGN